MKVFLIILTVCVLFRVLLPWLILLIANRKLRALGEYRGQVERIKLKVLKGTLIVENINLNKVDLATGIESPFFKASRIKICLQWRALFHRSIWGEIVIDESQIELIADKHDKSDSKTEDEKPFDVRKAVQDVIPFNIKLEIRNGKIKYTDSGSKSPMEIVLTNLDVKVLNFSNIKDQLEHLPATINATGDVYDGTLSFTMTLNPLAQYLTFDMNTELKNVNLVLLNAILRKHAGIDVNQGSFGMFIEVAAKDGEFKGYIKPIIKDLDVIGIQDRGDNFFSKLWEGFVASAYQVLKNKSEDQVATKITIEGKLDNPRINIVSAVVLILKNAFITALKPSIDDVIDIGSMRESVSKSKEFVKHIFKKESM